MTVTVKDEIELNGRKYKLKRSITGSWMDPFPEQFTTGDTSYDIRRDLSSWIISDLRGGIGVEEMIEQFDANRCWWTNCIIKYRGHILPPRQATEVTAPTLTAPTITNADMELDANWTGGARSNDFAHGGTYSWKRNNATQEVIDTYQDIAQSVYKNQQYTFTAWVYLATPISGAGNVSILIDDGVGRSVSTVVSTLDTWTQVSVQRTLNSAATRLRLIFRREKTDAGGNELAGYFDDASITLDSTVGTFVQFENFNGELYSAWGQILAKMNAGRTAWTAIHNMGATITALTASLNSRLYIYLGDSTNYYYMSISDAFTQSNSANANWGFQYDAKLFKVNTSGTVAYSTDPDGGGPTWTSGGAITDIADQIEGFVVGRDASGSIVPYAATNSIIKAYDSSTPQWVDTEAVLPNHPIGGKGHAYWNGKLYFSYGLAVKEYYPETGAFVDIGLTERDGVPVEYNGEITKLLGDTGVKGMFAAVDSSVTSGNSKSGLYIYDGGWQCWWVDTVNNGAMYDIIVSSAGSGYAVYWAVGAKTYYIDIPRGIENPDKITQEYETAGILLTPWFDAGNQAASKLAKLLADFASGVTTSETVALKFRIDHAFTDLDTGWTTMETLNTSGENGYNEELFASGAGVSYKTIQFRLDFHTSGHPTAADINHLVFYYGKRTGSMLKRVWNIEVLTDDYNQTKAHEKVTNLEAAIRSDTDVLFSYHPNDDSLQSYYVSVYCPHFVEQTGRDYNGSYQLQLIES